MKNSFSLIETLIATILLSSTITILLESKNFNINILNHIDSKNKYDTYISIHTISSQDKESKIDFTKLLSLKNDTLRRKLKEVKIEFRKDLIDTQEIEMEESSISLNKFEETYKSDNFGIKKYYRIELDE